MKRWIAAALAVVILASVFILRRPASPETTETTEFSQPTTEAVPAREEIRAVWISFTELSMLEEDDRSENAFRKKAKTMVRHMADNKMNTVFLHVRPCSDAFYRSEIYPFSSYLTGTEGKDPGYDPLDIFCEYASEAGLSVHAWINPFRICSAENMDKRAQSNPALQMPESVVTVRGGVYYNPADPAVHELILSGVRELLQNYPIDGIHIDDYFYPSTDDFIDAELFSKQTQLPLDEWRRDTISAFVHALYSTVKSYGTEKIFSISPAVDIERNTNELYADVTRWAQEPGYCDWIIPQLYVGFEHETFPFAQAADEWNALVQAENVRLLFGLSVYKCGDTDSYAGTGQKEWTEKTDILQRQLEYIRPLSRCSGFALFSYSYAFGKNMSDNSKQEIQRLTSVL